MLNLEPIASILNILSIFSIVIGSCNLIDESDSFPWFNCFSFPSELPKFELSFKKSKEHKVKKSKNTLTNELSSFLSLSQITYLIFCSKEALHSSNTPFIVGI